MTDATTRLSITGFGPSPDWINQKATELRTLFGAIALLKGNSDTGQLAKLVKIHTADKRLDLDLTLSRERASEMMRARFGNNSQ